MSRPDPAGRPRAVRLSALAVAAALAAGCDHPLPASGPTPRERMIAEYLDVPVATIQAFERQGLQPPAGARPRLDAASPEAVRLRRRLDRLGEADPAPKRAAP